MRGVIVDEDREKCCVALPNLLVSSLRLKLSSVTVAVKQGVLLIVIIDNVNPSLEAGSDILPLRQWDRDQQLFIFTTLFAAAWM